MRLIGEFDLRYSSPSAEPVSWKTIESTLSAFAHFGFDVTVEGTALVGADHVMLTRLAARYEEKYDWQFTVRDGRLVGDQQNVAIVYRIDVKTVYGFGKGLTYTQTRWQFD